MTEKLKTLMDDATGVEFATPDLDAIYRDGERTVRRRRVAVGAAGLAAAAVVAGAVTLSQGGDQRTRVADGPLRTDVPMWTQGGTLHTPDRTYDLGAEAVALARTSAGVAYVDRDGDVHAFDGSASRKIGETGEDPYGALVADSDGSRVGWVEGVGDGAVFVVHDLATGQRDTFPAHPDESRRGVLGLSVFLALDGSTAYWLDGGDTVATDLTTGESRRVGEKDGPTLVVTAEEGVTVHWVEEEGGGDLGTDVVGADGEVVLGYRDAGAVAALSPDAVWGAGMEDADVWELASGRTVHLDVGGRQALGYDWLDASTVMVVSESEGEDDEVLRLLRCQVPSGDCTEVADLDLGAGWVSVPSGGLLVQAVFGGGQESAEAEGGSEEQSEPSEATATERAE